MLYRLIKKVIFVGVTFLITFSQVSSFTGEINSNNSYLDNNKIKVIEKIDLVITGYYSPLPNQKKYITGSYEKEIALNGDGVGMASGKKVFTGAMAAPKKYDFGTKIYIEGYGIGVVEDRGGSIIDDEHTRIDIWMGQGDEGLERAIKLGSKKTVGYIVDKDNEVTFSFGEPVGENYINKYEYLKLSPESSTGDINEVQEFFKEVGFYFGEIDGKYNSIKPTIVRYQLQKGIIKSDDEEVAGYIGPKTISALNKDFSKTNSNILKKDEKEKLLKQVLKIKKKLGSKYELNAKKILEKIKVLKNKETLDIKTKVKLEYLEIIL